MRDNVRKGTPIALSSIAMLLGLGTAIAISVAACAPAGGTNTGPAQQPAAGPASTIAGTPTVQRPPTEDVATPGARPAATTTPPTPGSAPSPVPVGVNVGQRAPAFTLTSIDGRQVSLSDFRGKTVLVNFWASWCPPCKEEMPALNDLYQKYRDKDFVVLAVDMAEDPATVDAFVKKGAFSFPVVLDRSGDTSRTYQAISLPDSYIVGPDGVVLDRIIGAMTAPIMETKAQRFLAARGEPAAQPRSVAELQQSSAGQVVATIGGQSITMGDVNHRLDLLLALERLSIGAILDPSRASAQPELRERQRYAIDQMINERLLAEAAKAAGVEPDQADLEQPMRELASEAGGKERLPVELAKNGVTVEDLQAYLQEEAMANAYVLQVLAKQPGAKSMDDTVQQWIEAERARRNVKVMAPSR